MDHRYNPPPSTYYHNNMINGPQVPDTQIEKYSYFSLQNVIIKKIVDLFESLIYNWNIKHPIAQIVIGYMFLNPKITFDFLHTHFFDFLKRLNHGSHVLKTLITKNIIPTMKTFDIVYINEGTINHLYTAFDWYLKAKTNTKKIENHLELSLNKAINKDNLSFNILKSIPEEEESTFTFDNILFNYTKTSFEEKVHGPTGQYFKKNYKITFWSDCCRDETIDKLCNYVIKLYQKTKHDEEMKQMIYRNEGCNFTMTANDYNKRRIETVILEDDYQIHIRDILDEFMRSEERNMTVGIPHRKKFLFYGPPGTGKTSMINAISNHLKRHLHVINLTTIENDEMYLKLMSKVDYKTTILVFEDADRQGNVLHKRDLDYSVIIDKETNNQPNKRTLTLACILNHLDGLMNNHGMVAIITANDPKVFDEALIRDGRINERILFGYCKSHIRVYKIFCNIYEEKMTIPIQTFIDMLDLKKLELKPATVEGACTQFPKSPMDALKYISIKQELLLS